MKRITLSLIALLLCLCIQAQHRSEQEAIQIAQEFFAKKQMNKAPRLSVVPQQKVSQQIQRRVASAKKAPAQNSSFYIINDEENNRFVIVAADERLNTILGYSDEGMFISEKDNLILDLLNEYNRQYDYLLVHSKSIKSINPRKSYCYAISPLINTEWNGNRSAYKAKCPVLDNDTCSAGIVAVAMAQVMNYYQYPERGKGSISYTNNSPSITISHNFEDDHFDWNNMLDDYYGVEATQEQIDAVSSLLFSCGASVATQYHNSSYSRSSHANRNNIPYALINFFNYNPNLVAYERDYFSDEEWYDVLNQELEAKRPVLYGGVSDDKNATRVIVDGRDDNGLYHVNWGTLHNATRTANGYYSLDILKMIVWENGINIMEYETAYNQNQSMICRIYPSLLGVHEDVFYSDGFSIASMNIPLNESCGYALSDIYCKSTRSGEETTINYFMTNIAIGLFDANFNFIKTLSPAINKKCTCSTDPVLGPMSGSIRFDATDFQESKQYYIAPYALVEGETVPTRIRTRHGATNHYLAEVKDGVVTLTLMGKAKPSMVQTITLDDPVQTFCSDEDLDFTEVEGLKAYIATGFNPSNSEVVMLRVLNVPAETGLILKGTEGNTYEVPFVETDFVYSNLLVGVLEETVVNNGYVLKEGQFMPISDNEVIQANKAYLDLPFSKNQPLKIRFVDDEEGLVSDGIIKAKDLSANKDVWFTLQGVRLNGKPVINGVYLNQGRKVIVK